MIFERTMINSLCAPYSIYHRMGIYLQWLLDLICGYLDPQGMSYIGWMAKKRPQERPENQVHVHQSPTSIVKSPFRYSEVYINYSRSQKVGI